MTDYSKLTDAEFDRLLDEIVNEDCEKPSDLLSRLPGIYEIAREYFNNDVLAKWEIENPQDEDE